MFGAIRRLLNLGGNKAKLQVQASATKQIQEQRQTKQPTKPTPVVRSCSCIPLANIKRIKNRKRGKIAKASRKKNRVAS